MKGKIAHVQPHEINSLNNYPNVGYMVEFLNKFWEIQAKPKGYDELRKDYTDFDGMEEFDPKEMIDFFKGMESETAGSFGFPEQLSTPQVVYGECCQGRSPLHSIVSAVFSYSFLCGAKHQELKYVKSFEPTLELQEKFDALPDEGTPEQQIKDLKMQVKYLTKDIKHKLYFESLVTDHRKLDEVCPKEE